MIRTDNEDPNINNVEPGGNATRDREDRFRRIFDLAPVGMALTAPDGAFIEIDRALARMLGYSRAELTARNYKEFNHPEDMGITTAQILKLVSGEKSVAYFEKRYRDRKVVGNIVGRAENCC